jgi:hypothetical protein
MRSPENVEKLVRNAEMHSDPKANQAVLKDLLHQFDKTQKQEPAVMQPKTGRTIMRSPITKLAATAAVITVAALGLFEFLAPGSTSGVVWAEVARKVQASQGTIFRSIDTSPDSRDRGPDYSMNYLSSTQSRLDAYEGDQIVKTFCSDYITRTTVFIAHSRKSYIKRTFENMEQNDLWTNPKSMVQMFLSHEHEELGQKTIDGALCEGFETKDPAFGGSEYPNDSCLARIWISVETGYPVQFEIDIVRNGGEIRIGGVADQFQWDIELDESIFKPNIPSDYLDISPGE